MIAVHNRLDALVDHLLTFMTIPSWDVRGDRLFPHYPLTPQFFSGAEPLLGTEQTHAAAGDDYQIFTDAMPDDLDGRVNVAMISGRKRDGGWEEGVFNLTRLRGLSHADVRGRINRGYKHYVEVSRVWVDGERQAKGTRYLFGANSPNAWRLTQHDYRMDLAQDRHWSNEIQCLLGLQFAHRYFWSVELGYVGLPRIFLPTDPIGAREVFRLRDIPEGANRRAALRHWVTEHWRQRREGGEPILIRDYLRGQTEFTWNGLHCSLRPGRFDLERAEEYQRLSKEERKRLRVR